MLAKYDVNGDHVWSQNFGNMFNDVAGGLIGRSGRQHHDGRLVREQEPISFGDGDEHTSLGEADAYVARFTTDGKLEWAHTFGAEREDVAWGVASDAAGNTVTTGWFQNTVDFGKGAVASKGNKDVFALKLDAKGNVVWVNTWGDHDHDQARGVALDDKGNAVVVGIFRFKLELVGPAIEWQARRKRPRAVEGAEARRRSSSSSRADVDRQESAASAVISAHAAFASRTAGVKEVRFKPAGERHGQSEKG